MNKVFLEIMPIVFLFYIIVIIMLAEKVGKSKAKTPIQELLRKDYINFPTKFNVIEKFFNYVFIGNFILALFSITATLITEKNWGFISKLLKSIVDINNICIGITAVVITIAVIVVTFKKDYYLVFNINDVLRTQYFEIGIAFTILTYIASQLLTVIIVGIDIVDNLYYLFIVVLEELVIIINYVSSIFVLFIIFRVLFSKGYFELSILKHLYKKMWNLDTLLSNIYPKWNKYAININLTYIVQNYNKTVKKMNIKNIEKFQFVTLMGKGGIKWYKRAIRRIFKVCFALIIFSSIICILNGNKYLIILNVIIVVFIFFIFKNKKFMRKYYKYFNKLVFDSWGYYFKLNNEEYFCGIVSIFPPRKIENYIHSIQNIVCFARIGMEVKFENSNESVIEFILNKLQIILENEEYKDNYVRSIYLLPIFLIGYLQYQENVENNCMRISKNIYKELKLNNCEKFKFNEILYGLSLDISRELSNKDVINKRYCNYWRYLDAD